MKNEVLIQQIYPDTLGVKMLELIKERHQKYCDLWDIEYRPLVVNAMPDIPVEKGNWSRVKLILDALNEGFQCVYWLDADCIIYDFDTPLSDAISFEHIGVCWHRIPQLHHWNIGAMYIDNTEATRTFVADWLNGYKDSGFNWMEQGVFNELAKKGKIVATISDRWNATLDVTMVPDAVVLGFHGQGDTQDRINTMKEALAIIAKKESAQATQAKE